MADARGIRSLICRMLLAERPRLRPSMLLVANYKFGAVQADVLLAESVDAR